MPFPMEPMTPKPGAAAEEAEAPSTTLPIASYPDLEGAEEGQKVTLEGTIASNDGEMVGINCESVKLQTNPADKEMNRLTGKKGKPAPAPAADSEDEE